MTKRERKDTTIPILKTTRKKLVKKKIHKRQSFDELINLMLEGC